ncbi:polyhydroxyalkanoate biosynthesis repressor PhaR [Helicobacter sp. 13S00401-1]|uniref:N-acetylneuraminate synthase family protein n=1 Tax=Helicobacter sp. 13S00401-1 TaxID=1905758 RepID=UPI000BA6EC49|nr:N-acetylneuraminate synthase family protein [Helicobacter sp. 13S00401-1]PAF50168.1 polyhydroxyalkanoate biosynthesis repressor PhaR [Helicobacter sp. 13S00401-1]
MLTLKTPYKTREISKDVVPLVIAELGINHNGSLELAKLMVDSAKRAGIEVLKHQTHVIDDEMSKEATKVVPGNSDKSIYEIMKSCALSFNDERTLKEYVESKGMIFISTPFSRAAANRLEDMGVCAYKIGSGEMNNYPLIKHIASFSKPMIVSTGMNDLDSIAKCVDIIESKKVPLALMHTTNLYPTPPNLVRLGAMQEMMKAFPNLPIGLSDHTLNNNACIAAFALGASLVERHFTDIMDRVGPDIVCSMDEKSARALIEASKEVFAMRGGSKVATLEEQVTIDFAFATCVCIKDIKKGEVFSMDNIWVKRPRVKGALSASEFEGLLGKKAKVDITKDTHISKDLVL